jgi:hypothetical protein
LFIDEEQPREVIGVIGNTASVFFNTLEWQENPIVYVPASQGFAAIVNPEQARSDSACTCDQSATPPSPRFGVPPRRSILKSR